MEEKFQEYMEKTREYWSLKEKSLFHNLISLITSQKIKFSQSREIRKKLYLLNNGADEYCPKIFSNIHFPGISKPELPSNMNIFSSKFWDMNNICKLNSNNTNSTNNYTSEENYS
jgi:hypothetical protein